MSEAQDVSALVVLCTCAESAQAEGLARGAVEAGLVACVNVLPGIRSIYRWHGQVHEDSEVLLIMKTTQPAYPELEAFLLEQHPYETPEVLALQVAGVEDSYLAWLTGETACK